MNYTKMNLTALLVAAAIAGCDSKTEQPSGQSPQVQTVSELTIHAERISEGYMGNGVQFGLYEHCFDADTDWERNYGMYMDDRMWNLTFKRLDFMNLGLVRTMISSKSFCYRGKNSSGEPIIDNSYNIHMVDKWLDYCDARDIDVLWGEWGTGTIVSSIEEPLWANTIIDYAAYLINEKGHSCIKYFIPVNEPDGNWSDATKGNFNTWKAGAESVYRRINELGIQDRLSIAGPDACPGITGSTFIAYTANQVKDKIGLWNIHIYPYPSEIRSGSYESKISQWHGILGKDMKMVLGEVGMKYQAGTPEYAENIRRAQEDPMGKSDTSGGSNMFVYDFSYGIDIADLYIQCMRAGISGGCSWMVCDAMNTSPGQKMKRWGMWNIFGTKMDNAEDENVRPWYYTLSLLSHYFPKGSEILKVDASRFNGVRAVAGTKDGKLTIALVNNSEMGRKVKFSIEPALGLSPSSMTEYVFFEEDRPADNDQLPLPKGKIDTDFKAGVELDIPAKGFILLTDSEF